MILYIVFLNSEIIFKYDDDVKFGIVTDLDILGTNLFNFDPHLINIL